MQQRYQRWATLYDRKEAGAELDASELAELDALATDNPLCRAELELMEQLAHIDAGPLDARDRAAAERALATLCAQQDDTVVPLRPGTRPPSAGAAEGERSRRWMPWVASVTGATVVAAAFALYGTPSPLPSPGQQLEGTSPTPELPWQLSLTSGEVFIPGGDARVGRLPRDNRALRTAAGRACVTLPERATACLAPQTEVRIPPLGDGNPEPSIEVVSGKVVVSVVKQADGSSFSLSHGALRARALGTLYGLELLPNGERVVGVLEGRVEVRGDASEAILDANTELVSSAVGSAAPLHAERARAYRDLLGDPVPWPRDAQAGVVVHLESEPRGADVRLDGQTIGTSPLSVLMPHGTHAVELRLSGYGTEQLSFTLDSAEEHRFVPFLLQPSLSAPPEPTPARGSATSTAGAAKSPAELLQRARQLVSKGQWASAASVYRELRRVHPNSAEAKTVLVALGQLELDRLGQPELAKRSFAAYLGAGGGALSQEARYGKIRALRRLGAESAERAAIDEYLVKHPSGIDAAALRERRRELRSARESRP